jgi:ABC-type polysaccharide/polyol phosphate export permease
VLRYRYLFEQMVRRELRQRYKGSALGILWYVVNPLVLMGAYTLMFGVILDAFPGIEDYPLFLLVGIVVWVFFSGSLLAAAPSLLDQSALIRKVRFPREAIPASVVTVQLITFVVILALLTPVALIIRGSASPALLLLPVILAALYALALGGALIVSVLHAYFRDIAPILAAALLPWFFITPIFYLPQDTPGVADHPFVGDLLTWANPIAPFIQAVRDVLYSGVAPGLDTMAYVVVAGGLVLAAGRGVFARLQSELAVVL